MAKILNLDKLDTKLKPRELVIDGKTHVIQEMTVANFIATTRAAAEMVDASIADQIEGTVELICRSIPTLTPEQLNLRSLEQLSVIAAFVRGDEIAEAEDSVEGDGEGK